MKNFHNSGPRRLDYEKRGIALMRSGSYVSRELDKDELDALMRTDFTKVQFNDFPSVIVTNALATRGTRGKLVRVACLSKDQQYAKFCDEVFPKSHPPTYVSLHLIQAQSFLDWHDFLREVTSAGQAVEIRSVANPVQQWAGLLFGSENDVYSSVIFPNPSANKAPFGLPFHYKDVEFERNPYNSDQLVTIIARNSETAQRAAFVLKEL